MKMNQEWNVTGLYERTLSGTLLKWLEFRDACVREFELRV